MTIQIKVVMPNANDFARQCRVMRALESATPHTFSVQFVEATGWMEDRIDVDSHNKGIGPKTRELWTTVVRDALL